MLSLILICAGLYAALQYGPALYYRYFAPVDTSPVPSASEAAEALKTVKARVLALGTSVEAARPLFDPIEEKLKGT